jgi:hypothetical protein
MAAVELLADRQADDGVAEELEAFVLPGRPFRVLVQPGAMDEGALEERWVAERELETLRELEGGSRRAGRVPRQ